MYGDVDSLIWDQYNNNLNYKIEYNKEEDSNLCVIYFSSNGLYFPNTIAEFTNTVLNRDKYEWCNSKCRHAKKHIFIRDILKQWYVLGINKNINTIDKLKDFLTEETKGFEVVTVGVSSGGYASILFGLLLNAKYILTFSPQINLNYYFEQKDIDYEPLIDKYKSDSEKNKYYNLTSLLNKSNIPIFYFMPSKCRQDIYHYNLIKDIRNIYCFRFNSNHHGTAMYNFNTKYIINSSYDNLLSLYDNNKNNIIDKNSFAIQCYGIVLGIENILKEIFKKVNKLIHQKIVTIKA